LKSNVHVSLKKVWSRNDLTSVKRHTYNSRVTTPRIQGQQLIERV